MFRMVTLATIALIVFFNPLPARTETAWVPADRDTTLIEDSGGALSSGAGSALYVGRTNQAVDGIRRGLLRFDVASAIPRHAKIESVALHLTALPGNPGASPVHVYRVLSDWGEGASISAGGRGAPSEPGDATWIHTFYDTDFWKYAGGHFVKKASTVFVVDGPGEYTVTGSHELLADVRHWKAARSRNYGWILIGDESRPQSAQPFATRENTEPGLAPVLEIVYREVGKRPAFAPAQIDRN
jgi:hypothetical protein